MTFRFKQSDNTVEDGVRRIAIDQIDKAMRDAADVTRDSGERVHKVRKRCKKLRGLIRPCRPAFDPYKAENDALRDAAGALSFLRDADMLIATYDDLTHTHNDQIDRRAFAPIRRRLTLRRKDVARSHDIADALGVFRERMAEMRERAARWRLNDDGFDALAGGLAKTYKRARKAMRRLNVDPGAEALHEWRKRVKYHWYHTRLLQPIWPALMQVHRDSAKRLGDLLGAHHDLATLQQAVAADPDSFGRPARIEVFLELIARRQSDLEAEALSLSTRLLAESPAGLVQRWGAYWSAWRKDESTRVFAIAAE